MRVERRHVASPPDRARPQRLPTSPFPPRTPSEAPPCSSRRPWSANFDAGNLTSFAQLQDDTSIDAWTYATPPQFGEIPSRTAGATTDTHVWDGVNSRMTSWDTSVSGSTTVQRDFSYDGAGRLVEVVRAAGGVVSGSELYYDVDDALVYEVRNTTDIYERFQGHRVAPDGSTVEPVLGNIRVVTRVGGDQEVLFAYVDVDGQAVSVYALDGALRSREVTGAYGVPLSVGAHGGYASWESQPGNWVVDGLHGQEEDRGNEVMHFGTRHTMFRDGMWLQPEPLLMLSPRALGTKAPTAVYADGKPLRFHDVFGYNSAPFSVAALTSSATTHMTFSDTQQQAIRTVQQAGAAMDGKEAVMPLALDSSGQFVPANKPMHWNMDDGTASSSGMREDVFGGQDPAGNIHSHPKSVGARPSSRTDKNGKERGDTGTIKSQALNGKGDGVFATVIVDEGSSAVTVLAAADGKVSWFEGTIEGGVDLTKPAVVPRNVKETQEFQQEQIQQSFKEDARGMKAFETSGPK